MSCKTTAYPCGRRRNSNCAVRSLHSLATAHGAPTSNHDRHRTLPNSDDHRQPVCRGLKPARPPCEHNPATHPESAPHSIAHRPRCGIGESSASKQAKPVSRKPSECDRWLICGCWNHHGVRVGPKLSDPAGGTLGLQPQRPAAVRWCEMLMCSSVEE